MITIKQLATELGVTKQAVYNRIIRDPLKSVLTDLGCEPQRSENGTIILSEKCAETIRNLYKKKYYGPDNVSTGNWDGKKRDKNKMATSDELKILLMQVNNLQTMMSNIANVKMLQEALCQKKNEITNLSNMITTLREIADIKDAKLYKLYEKYSEAVSRIKIMQAQIKALTKQLALQEPGLQDTPNSDDF